MLKVVLDTNVYISAFLTPGKPRDVLNLCRDNKVRLFVSEYILDEISRVLKEKIVWPDWKMRKLLAKIRKVAVLVFPTERINQATVHSQDNRILECAFKGAVDYIVTGDKKHILPLKKFRGIKVLTPADFLAAYEKV